MFVHSSNNLVAADDCSYAGDCEPVVTCAADAGLGVFVIDGVEFNSVPVTIAGEPRPCFELLDGLGGLTSVAVTVEIDGQVVPTISVAVGDGVAGVLDVEESAVSELIGGASVVTVFVTDKDGKQLQITLTGNVFND